MLRKILLALALIAAVAACNAPAATTTPSLAPIDTPGLESPSDGGTESMEPSEEPSAS